MIASKLCSLTFKRSCYVCSLRRYEKYLYYSYSEERYGGITEVSAKIIWMRPHLDKRYFSADHGIIIIFNGCSFTHNYDNYHESRN